MALFAMAIAAAAQTPTPPAVKELAARIVEAANDSEMARILETTAHELLAAGAREAAAQAYQESQMGDQAGGLRGGGAGGERGRAERRH